jgi:STE24 endopeptidase
MNIYGFVILAALMIRFLLRLLSNALNLKALQPDLPPAFQDVYDAEKYRRSQEYTRVLTRFGLFTSTVNISITLVFWCSGGFNVLDQFVRNWQLGPILTGLVYIGIFAAVMAVLSFPFSAYHTFVIEERFGFNKTTPKTFVLDLIKSLVLATIIGGSLLTAILTLFQYAGQYAWIYCWVAWMLFVLFMLFIGPTWILPLFNKFTPLDDGELRTAIESYADDAKFSLKNIFVMDGSKRSSKSNAFLIGFGRYKRIALFDTLIDNHTVGELVAILAHEIGHFKKKHIWQNMILGSLEMGLIFFLMSIFLGQQGLFEAFFVEKMSIYVGLFLFSLLYSPLALVLSVLMHIFSRKVEYEADRFAATTTNDPEDLVNALKKLSSHNLSNLTPHPFHVFLNYSHPPVLARIRAIQAAR